jgi:hypothetical protein
MRAFFNLEQKQPAKRARRPNGGELLPNDKQDEFTNLLDEIDRTPTGRDWKRDDK